MEIEGALYLLERDGLVRRTVFSTIPLRAK